MWLKLTGLSAQSHPEYSFSNSPLGAKASAIIYSIVRSAKENGLNPFEYLKYLFEMLPNSDVTDPAVIDGLLPHSPTLPACCRIQTAK